MTTWSISNEDAARDLRVDTEADARQRLAETVPPAPDFTKLRGPSNRFSRRLDGRNN
jgi:hypothetical protein